MTSFPLPPLDGDPGTLQFILDQIAQGFIDTGGRQIKIRFGNDAVTWPGASNTSNVTTVDHGLGSIPVEVYVSSRGGSHFCELESNDSTWTSTQFGVGAYSVDGVPALNDQTRFSWWAIG